MSNPPIVNRRLIYGSTALSHVDKRWKYPKDKDVLYPKYRDETMVYFGADSKGVPPHIFDLLESKFSKDGMVTPYGIYNVKISHSFWNIKWMKTARDIIRLQEVLGFQETDQELMDILRGFWETIHGSKKHINLMQSPDKFFTKAVDRKYKHDDLHEALKYHAVPWHERLRNDKTKVYIPKENFDVLSHKEKLEVCREEIYVTAIERYYLKGSLETPLTMYRSALKKLVTTMSKGWFPLFIMENLKTLKEPDLDYIEKFNTNIKKITGD